MKKTLFIKDKSTRSFLGYLRLCFPILLFPLMFYPYKLVLKSMFVRLLFNVFRDRDSQIFKLVFSGGNTIFLFWILVTVAVMLISILVSIFRVRPYLAIPVYLAVIFSLSGIFSLIFYSVFTR